MNTPEYYSIGDMSRLCNVSKKTLRFYDSIGLISSVREEKNNYRFYTERSLLMLPVIKYYKQMGFQLEEIRSFLEGNSDTLFTKLEHDFHSKTKELQLEQESISRKLTAVQDWHTLIHEARMVLNYGICDVSIRYVENTHMLYQQQQFTQNLEASIINMPFMNYVEGLNNGVTGPVVLHFTSQKQRLQNQTQDIYIMQKPLLSCSCDLTKPFGGQMMVACYHIGPHASLPKTYEKIQNWAHNHNYSLRKESYERYVTDYWTTRNDQHFVTEVLIPLQER